MKSLRVLFLGNHTLGVRTLAVIGRHATLVGVVAHPVDPEDGVRYESVYAVAQAAGLPVTRLAGRSPKLETFVRACRPDLLWITDYRYIIPEAVLALAPLGAVNLHPSLLPAYRGRAPVNWGILRGETEFGLTAHFVDAGMDTGDIIAQRRFALAQSEDVGDALARLYPLYESITAEVLEYFHSGAVPRRAQAAVGASAFPRRTPEDGLIDWTQSATVVWNLVRAVAAPYPGAFTRWHEGRLLVWKVEGVQSLPAGSGAPGEVIEVSADGRRLVVACGDDAVVVSNFSFTDPNLPQPVCGDVVGGPVLAEVAP